MPSIVETLWVPTDAQTAATVAHHCPLTVGACWRLSHLAPRVPMIPNRDPLPNSCSLTSPG